MISRYSEAHWETIQSTVGRWHHLFRSSAQFQRLREEHRASAYSIIEAFARYAYVYLGSSPDDWDDPCVRECCVELLPRKVPAGRYFFEAVAPVLAGFFEFLAGRALLSDAQALAEAAGNLGDVIVANSEDQERWGAAKKFAMAARKAGFDVRDPDALQAWCREMNLRFLGQFKLAGRSMASWSGREDSPAETDQPLTMAAEQVKHLEASGARP